MAAAPRRLRFILVLLLLATPLALYSQSALQFVAVTPCRVVDTRNPVGPFGGPPISGNGERDFAIPNGSCSIPSSAASYSLNVTVVPHVPLGYLTVWPTGQTRPVLSTLNSLDGRTKANAAIIPAGSGGSISVYATNTTDVVLDIDGYFVPASTSTLALFPLQPCRVADTRWTGGPLGGPKLTGGIKRDFPVLSSSCNVPSTAQGYSLNFTAVPSGALGYLSVWPTGQSQPLVSTLNDLTATVVANAAIVPAGSEGEISVFASNDTDLVIDIDGYFAPANSGQDALSLYTLAPCRVLDTRNNVGPFTGMIPVGVLQSTCQVPSAQAYVLNATVIPQNSKPLGYLTLWPDAEDQPVVSTLNALDGAVTSNMAIVPTQNGSVDAYVTNPTDLVLDIFSYFAQIEALSITNTTLPSGVVNYNYSTTMAAAGGVAPYAWSISSGHLPTGLSLNASTGVLSGTPSGTGNFTFTVKVTDAQTPPATASSPLAITISATMGRLQIMTASLPGGTQNQSYSTMLAASGGITPYSWSITSGSLPAGLSLSSSTGAIAGTPSSAGTSYMTVQVSDSETPAGSVSVALSIAIAPGMPLIITTTSLPAGTVDVAYSASLTAAGGVAPYTWAITSGSLPTGLTLNTSTGAITGTPTLAGTANFTVKATDSELQPVSVTAQLSLTINSNGSGGGALSGHYAFYLSGFNSDGAWTLAGSFVSDGNGNITSGVVDGNSTSEQPFSTALTGSYSITSMGLNLLTLQGQSFGPVTLAFVLSSTGNGRIIEYDDTTGTGSRGSGALRKQNTSAFSLSQLHGGYAYGMTGESQSGAFSVNIGQFTLSNGSISNGSCDVNEGGGFGTCTFSGTMSAVDSQTGRSAVTVQTNHGTSHVATYVVSASELVMESIDPTSQNQLLEGSILQQSGTFSAASLSGTTVSYARGIVIHSGYDMSHALIGTFDGHGNWSMTDGDEDVDGVMYQITPYQGTYTVAANGAVTRIGNGATTVGFLVSQNKAFLVSEVNIADYFSLLEPQTGAPFSNESIKGSYAGGSLAPMDYTHCINDVAVMSGDGQGTLTEDGDYSKSDGLDQSLNNSIPYSMGSDGRGTAPGNPTGTEGVFYVISPTKWIGLNAEHDARLVVLEH